MLALAHLVEPVRPLAIALTPAAFALAGLAARAALDLAHEQHVRGRTARPGDLLALAGAALLVVASRPRPAVLAAGLVALRALALVPASDRPGPGYRWTTRFVESAAK